MSETTSIPAEPSYPQDEIFPQPQIIYGKGSASTVSISPEHAAETMRELGISDNRIAVSAVYVDFTNRLLNNGTHYSNRLGRLRFRSVPELRDVEGDVIRISTKVRGKNRSEKQMNTTATHEWEHLAQADRHDRRVSEGRIAIYGLAAAGALAGNRLGKNDVTRKAGAAIGTFLGYQLGYWLAPHERQARAQAGQISGKAPQVISTAIRRENQ